MPPADLAMCSRHGGTAPQWHGATNLCGGSESYGIHRQASAAGCNSDCGTAIVIDTTHTGTHTHTHTHQQMQKRRGAVIKMYASVDTCDCCSYTCVVAISMEMHTTLPCRGLALYECSNGDTNINTHKPEHRMCTRTSRVHFIFCFMLCCSAVLQCVCVRGM